MAGEITGNVTLRCTNGTLVRGPFSKNLSITQSTARGGGPTTWIVGTSEEDFSFGDVVPGLVMIFNTDPTNYVDWGMSDGGTMKAIGRLMPGEPALFRIKPSTTLRAQANTASVNVDIFYLNT